MSGFWIRQVYLPWRPEVRIWCKIRFERIVLFEMRAAEKFCAARLPARGSSVQLYSTYFLCGRLQVLWKMTPRGRVGYLQRDCYFHLYCIPRQTRAGILDAQLESKAYFGVQNHTPLDRDRRTKIHRKMQCHHHTQQYGKNDDKGAPSKCQR